jgi:hypothetical protein
MRLLCGGADETPETARTRALLARRGAPRTEVVGEAVGLELVAGLVGAGVDGLDAALHAHAPAIGIRAGTGIIGEAQGDVRRDQIGEEPEGARAIGERMEHLEVDPATMMHDAEQQGALVRLVDGGAGVLGLRDDLGAQVAVLQVVPEHPSTENRPIEGVPVERGVQRSLQRHRVDVMIHLRGHAEHLRIRVAAGGEEHRGGVVEPHPGAARHAGALSPPSP